MKPMASSRIFQRLLHNLHGFEVLLGSRHKCLTLMGREGDMMESDKKDKFIEEVDQELRSIESRLKKVLSEANALLKAHARGTGDAEENDEGESGSAE